MSESKNRNKRRLRNILVNPKFQLKYVMLACGAGIVLSVANANLFYHYISENYAILVDLSVMTDEVKAQLHAELRTIVTLLLSSSLLFVALVGWLALVLSHKAAGPLYHFRRVFEQIRGGDKSARVRLRPDDDFQEVAASFNKMMDSVFGEDGTGRS